MIRVEVVYALPDQQILIPLQVGEGTTALQAVKLSGIGAQIDDFDVSAADMGVYSRLLDGRASPLPQDYVLRDHDRVELYRPLQLDPKQARLLRARRAAEREQRSQMRHPPGKAGRR